MKKIFYLLLLLSTSIFYAQTSGISYQAVIYNPNGQNIPGVNIQNSPMVNRPVCLRFNLIDNLSQLEYQEVIQTTTDEFGMVNLTIGSGNQTGGYSSSFDSVVWNSNTKSLKVEFDTNGNCQQFVILSSNPFSTVPFAYAAASANNVSGVVAIQNGGTGATTITDAKINLGLNNVDNTSDLNKPISIATQTALDAKENTITPGTTAQYYRGDKTWQTLDKSAVGLTNVDNTSDLNKPISTATQTALDTKENLANKSTTTTLGSSNTLYPTQNAVKTYVDTQITLATTPDATTTIKGKIQLAGDLGGTATSPTVPGLANKENTIVPGTTTQYYRGDKTWQTLDKATVGLANVDNTPDANKPISTATQAALNTKENTANKSISVPLDGTSNIKFPSVKAVKDYVDGAIAVATIPDATTTVKGKIQLAGDLGGTAAAPTVPGLANKENTIATGTTAQYFRGDKTWQTLDKSTVGLPNVNNTSDLNKPISIATQTALDTKENLANKSTTTSLGTSNDLYPTQNAVKTYVDTQIASATIPDATTAIKGKIQLAGDLTGTAISPEIATNAITTPKLANTAVTTEKISDANVTYAKIQNVSATDKVLGRISANAGVIEEIATTGLGNVVRATSPTLVTPNLGTPSSLVLSNATGLNLTTGVSGVLPIANGGTGSSTKNFVDLSTNQTIAGTKIFNSDSYINQLRIGKGSGNNIQNTAFGYSALNQNTTGEGNTALGFQGLMSNTTGNSNTAVGFASGIDNATGSGNTSVGYQALQKNSGNSNIAIGTNTMYLSQNSNSNIAIGNSAIISSNGAGDNLVIGNNSAPLVTSASRNVIIGNGAGNAITTETNNTIIGYNTNISAGATNATALGNGASVNTSNKIQLGNSAITSVNTSGVITANGFIKSGGTAAQFLKADGTVDTTTYLSGTVPITNGGTGAITDIGARANLGLSNVDNTTDLNKPISTATQTALDTKENLANKSTVTTLGTSNDLYPTQNAVKTYVDTQIASATIVDADATTKGKIQLAGDLGGSAAAPTVPGLANKENTITAGTTAQYYRGDKTWQTLDKSAAGLENVDNTSDLNKPVSTATQTALDTKENIANKSTDVNTDGTSDEKYPSVKAVKDYVDSSIVAGSIPDATASSKGKIQLAGDLTGTAASPTVAAGAITTSKLADNAVTSAKIVDGAIVTSDLADDAVISAKIVDGAIVTIDLADDAVTSAKIVDGTIVTIDLADDAVETAKIKDANVTNVKLDKANIPLSGFGAAAADVDFGSNKLTNVTDPTTAQDAATKNYVDTTTSTITTLADGKIYLGNASNVATEVTPTGDVTITNAGVTAIGASKVVTTMIADDAVETIKIKDANVTYAKIQNVSATDKVLGRVSTGAGEIEEIATTGSGDVVRATSPTLVTPNLGIPTAVDLTNATGLPLTSAVTGTLPVANGGTGLTSLTAGYIPFGNGTGALSSSSNFTWDNTNKLLMGVYIGRGADNHPTNTAYGFSNLAFNNGGYYNVALGNNALSANTNASYNTGVGYSSLTANTTGSSNTALGYSSLISNTTGGGNNAFGFNALASNTIGSSNTAVGNNSLSFNTANGNTAIGVGTLVTNTTGTNNTAVGLNANVSSNNLTNATAIGSGALVDASNKIQLGDSSVTLVNTSGKFKSGAVTYPNSDGAAGQILTTNGSGVASFASIPSTNLTSGVTGTLPIANGGTGSTTQNFVDLTTNQSVSGNKTFRENITVNYGADGSQAVRIGSKGGNQNTMLGNSAFLYGTPGIGNTAIGAMSLASLEGGNDNTALGSNSIRQGGSADGSRNTAIGSSALSNGSGTNDNTALGYATLAKNGITGGSNVAVGNYVLQNNTTAYYNVGVGFEALKNTTTGGGNTAIGHGSMLSNTTGDVNTAIGENSLISNTTGRYNTSIGVQSQEQNTTGGANTAIGVGTMDKNTTGSNNAVLGAFAGRYIADGTTFNTAMNNSVLLGYNSKPLANNDINEIVIGYGAIGNGSNTATIGGASTTDTYVNGKLNISSTIKIAGGTPGIGKVLTSDANGLGSWAALPATNLASGVTGTLPIANGGTGTTTATGTGNIVLSNTPTLVTPVIGAATGTSLSVSGQLTSTVATGTAPLVVTSTTPVANLSIGGNAATVTTNANLTGDVTSVGNATTVGKINGTALSGLATGILKNTTSTGVPSIAVAADFPTLNQNTTGTAANVTGTVAIANGGTGSTTQNFVDLTTTQTIAGTKTFSSTIVGSITGNAATATTATNIAGGAAGSIPYQTAAATTAMLAKGTDGQLLTLVSGSPSWSNAAGSTVVTSSTTYAITLTDAYVFYTGTAAGALTIPAAASTNAGKAILIKNKTAYSITITPATTGNIYIDSANTAANTVTIGIEASNNWIKLVSDGTQWNVLRALF